MLIARWKHPFRKPMFLSGFLDVAGYVRYSPRVKFMVGAASCPPGLAVLLFLAFREFIRSKLFFMIILMYYLSFYYVDLYTDGVKALGKSAGTLA